jgi:PTS system nitrogen regulatory IIA component
METMDIAGLAAYLKRDAREVGRLADRGVLPGRKVGGQWRFAKAEINHWLESRLHEYSESELADLESAHAGEVPEPLLTNLLSESLIAVPMLAHSKPSVLRELVKLAESSWQVYDPDAIHEAIRQREEMGSTALAWGVAIPHPHRPVTAALGESLVAFGRTPGGIPFGADRGGLTDLFFLVCCTDDRTHLRVLARLTRLLQRPGFLEDLRAAEAAAETYELFSAAERELLET